MGEKTVKKNIIRVLAVSATLSVSSGTAWAECGEVSISEMNWESAAIVTAVSKFLMEQGYGCSVTVVPTSSLPAVASVAETGEPDILTELWATATPAYAELEAEGKVKTVANVLSDGGVEGWYVPTYLVEKHPDLATMEGILANPELVGGRFHNAPEGWGARVKNDNLIEVWDFESHGLEVFNHGSGETLAASIGAAYDAKEPWFGYYWAPTSVLGRYPMVKVDIGSYRPEVMACVATEDCANPRKTDYAPAVVVTGVTPSLADRAPEIVDLMSNVSFTNDQMGKVLAWQEDKNASSDEAAVYFLTNHKDLWSGWLNDAARKKLAPLLN